MHLPRHRIFMLLAGSLLALSGCSSLTLSNWGFSRSTKVDSQTTASTPVASEKAHDVVLFALGLVETGYRFGGKNPEAGLDCSGMVHYVFNQVTELKLAGSAADMARHGKVVDAGALRPGDLVFFNTMNQPYSHVGIYIGDGRFVHAPSSGGKVRTENLREGWFAARFEEARTYFD